MEMMPWEQRTLRLIGETGAEKLARSHVLVVGVGGVGGYAAEILCRTGIGRLTLVDADNVSVSNINRQLIATHASIGLSKVILFAERFHEINPACSITVLQEFVTPERVASLLEKRYDFVVDAIDTVAPKTALIKECILNKIPVISSMGAGGRMDPAKVRYADLWDTREDGLARAVRTKLRKQGLRRPLPVVASDEAPREASVISVDERNKRSSYGTTAAVPAIFGIFLAQYVINKILAKPL